MVADTVWRLTTHELEIALAECGGDEFPAGLTRCYDGVVEGVSGDDVRAQVAAVREALTPSLVGVRRRAVEILAAPFVSISVWALEVESGKLPVMRRSMHAVRDDHGFSVVVGQSYSPLGQAQQDVTFLGGEKDRWVERVAGVLPPSPGRGLRRSASDVVMRKVGIGERDRWLPDPDGDDDSAAAAFTRLPATLTARFDVTCGSRNGVVPQTHAVFLVNDVVREGRYGLLMRDGAVADGVDNRGVEAALNLAVEYVVEQREVALEQRARTRTSR